MLCRQQAPDPCKAATDRGYASGAAEKLQKKETQPSWVATVSREVVKTECPLYIREIIAKEDNVIHHAINTFSLYEVCQLAIGVHHVSFVSVH